jgi:hypothetical protein
VGPDFNRREYFSQSSGEYIPVEEMALPYVRNAYARLVEEYADEFIGSPLCSAMIEQLYPGSGDIDESLSSRGWCSIWVPGETRKAVSSARAAFYRAGKRIGKKVHTHKEKDFVRGTIDTGDFRVTYRRVSST